MVAVRRSVTGREEKTGNSSASRRRATITVTAVLSSLALVLGVAAPASARSSNGWVWSHSAGIADGALLPVLEPISRIESVSHLLGRLSMTAATATLTLGVVAALLTSGNPASILRRRG